MSQYDHTDTNIVPLQGMYKEYFLDYASYVILERAIPAIEDGLKPVQRRILHALKQMDDGRYHKVANIIGQTMQYHPHGDAAIGDALVNVGQKGLMIDTQGNWGDYRTGDRAAAPRYIEARLTKFALEVAFNAQTTEWQRSYDGRKNEPITLPMKFPLVLSQGADGIAVGLSTKILPHNFIELIKASIKHLEGKPFTIYPDFPTGGFVDVAEYKSGKRGGRVKVRVKIEATSKNTLKITELPYSVTTTSLIESIIKANDKGKIKIKNITDNTARDVEINIELVTGTSPDKTIDALYAFTSCETSISPNACIIIDDKPHFLTVNEILRTCTDNTKRLLGLELDIKLAELNEKWHFSSLEKIFIQNRIYHEIEECETWEAVLQTIDKELRKYVATPSDNNGAADSRFLFKRDVTQEDIARLTEIKIKRISKYNKFKADELIARVEAEIKEVQYNIDNLTEFSIKYFQNLLDKYSAGKERKTKISSFESIDAVQVIATNTKLYVNRKEGFIGKSLKKDEFVKECSDISDIIAFRKDGKAVVSKIADKTFVGKNILHVDVWQKGDERTIYHMLYVDGKSGITYMKRFNVKAVTRDKEYDLTKGNPNSKCLYFSANPNGESEVVKVTLSPGCKAKKKVFEFDFGELVVKGRGSQGNILTKYPVKKVEQILVGKSTLGAEAYWLDDITGRLNKENRGIFLGDFDTGDHFIYISKKGTYEICTLDESRKFEPKNIVFAKKWQEDHVMSAIYYDAAKDWTVVKRFMIETSSQNQAYSFIGDHSSSKLYFATGDLGKKVVYTKRVNNKTLKNELDIDSFIDVKGWKALGNKLHEGKTSTVQEVVEKKQDKEQLSPGDTIEFTIPKNGQTNMFDTHDDSDQSS